MSSPNFAFSWNIMRSATLPGALFITKNASRLTVKKSNNAISSLFQTIFSSSTAHHDNRSNNRLINFKLILGKKTPF